MLYAKNLPAWERIARVAMGIVSLVYAGMNWGASSLAVGLGILGAILAMTGMIGFCPMCAMAGRKLNKGDR